jgi:hypothetical protein
MTKVTSTKQNKIDKELQQTLEYKLLSMMNNYEMNSPQFDSAETQIRKSMMTARCTHKNNARKGFQQMLEYKLFSVMNNPEMNSLQFGSVSSRIAMEMRKMIHQHSNNLQNRKVPSRNYNSPNLMAIDQYFYQRK